MLAAESLLSYDVLAAAVAVSFIFHDAEAVSRVAAVLEALLAEQGLAVDLAIETTVAYIVMAVL